MSDNLITKYNIPGPRYTSYPTVPYWDESGIELESWKETVIRAFCESNENEGISLYIHLPFCESLCTFCGCHKRITKNHGVEGNYVDALLKEWRLYCELVDEEPRIQEIHLGGGTPTFFAPKELERMIQGLFLLARPTAYPEFSFEGHPNNTSEDHLKVLRELGFQRVSFGVQDYDPKVQKTINRIQPLENVVKVTELSRELGYNSISHDLVYGLPHQTTESIENTIAHTRDMKPDRIAFYSYAHVPWIKGNGQRGFDENDLPRDDEKRNLYERGREMLEEIGYKEIGMDHFALEHDELYKAIEKRTIHRNFMGYTASKTLLMIGLGTSSISDSWYAFAQNDKTVEGYYERLERNEIPIFRGHLLNEEDLIIRRHILNIMCHFETSWAKSELQFPELPDCLIRLKEMENDGLVELHSNGLSVPPEGRPFIRNICMAFDLRLLRNKPATRIFSMTI